MQPAATALAAILHEWKVLKLRNRFKIKLQVVHQTGYMFYGVIDMFNLVVRHRLHHGLAAMERPGGGRSSKIVSKTDEVNCGILQAANQILILFIKVFAGNIQDIYNTPDYPMKFTDMNFEDKVLLQGGSIVVKQYNSIRLYGLDVRSSMEDQIYQTIKDSIKVMTTTLSKDLTDIHSMLRKLVGTLTMSKPKTMEFQRFFGENPELWISQDECYFKFYEITQNHKLDRWDRFTVVSMAFPEQTVDRL
ncbi:hypothetical protein KY285_036980 [Solanum tuberosum]|nr:hypothetical protein KY285_036980 [Solanum tuberosum]